MVPNRKDENTSQIVLAVEENSLMRRNNFADLTAFVAVADQRSFRAAAARIGVTPSALSHTMRQLEERLGVRLLNRTTRSVSPTDAGLRLLDRLRPVIKELDEALDDVNRERSHPFGRLRIHASHVAAAAIIAPVWRRFLCTYPDVQMEIHVDDSPVDIVAQGFDAGIGPSNQVAADMIAVRVMGPMKVAVVGAPAYFARRRPPRAPEDLARHDCIQYRLAPDGGTLEWQFEREGKSQEIAVEGRVTVNSMDLAVRGALDGLGIAYIPVALAEPFLRSGQLIRVLEDWSPCFQGLFLYYPGHRQIPAALRALIDTIRATNGANGSRAKQGNADTNPFIAKGMCCGGQQLPPLALGDGNAGSDQPRA
jgi:DNA-binding transcriptional LysR family regulator